MGILEDLTGSRQLDAGPLLEYFAPLHAFLDAQSHAYPCDWDPNPPSSSSPSPSIIGPRGKQQTYVTVFIVVVALLFVAVVAGGILTILWWSKRKARYHLLEKHTAVVLQDFIVSYDDDSLHSGNSGNSGNSDDDGLGFGLSLNRRTTSDRVFGSSSTDSC